VEQFTEKKHNTAKTSILSFQQLSNEGRLIDEKQLCFKAIKEHGPINSRQLASLIKRESTNVTRSLYDLCHEITPSVMVVYTAKCPVTNRKTKFYATSEWYRENWTQLWSGKLGTVEPIEHTEPQLKLIQ
jgi:hypothetical protein